MGRFFDVPARNLWIVIIVLQDITKQRCWSSSTFNQPYRVQGAGCRVPGDGCRVPDAGCRMPGAGCRVSGTGCQEDGIWYDILLFTEREFLMTAMLWQALKIIVIRIYLLLKILFYYYYYTSPWSPCFQDGGSHSKPKIVYSYQPGNGPCVRKIHNEFEFEHEQSASGRDVSSSVMMALPTALIAALYRMLWRRCFPFQAGLLLEALWRFYRQHRLRLRKLMYKGSTDWILCVWTFRRSSHR